MPSATEHQLTLLPGVLQANALAPNWGQTIFQSANEIASNAVLRKRLDEIQAQADSEKEWWEKRRASIQKDFLKELDDDESKTAAEKTAATAGSAGAANKAPSEDGVLVDAASSTPPAPAPSTPSGSSKKKKGKK
jgi:translocation protein SEC66